MIKSRMQIRLLPQVLGHTRNLKVYGKRSGQGNSHLNPTICIRMPETLVLTLWFRFIVCKVAHSNSVDGFCPVGNLTRSQHPKSNAWTSRIQIIQLRFCSNLPDKVGFLFCEKWLEGDSVSGGWFHTIDLFQDPKKKSANMQDEFHIPKTHGLKPLQWE